MPFLKTSSSKKKAHDDVKHVPQMLQHLPVAHIGKDFVKRKDGRYVAIYAVNPINMPLLAPEEEVSAVQAVREAVNTAPHRLQILVSSERLNLSDYIQTLQDQIDEAQEADQVEHLESMIEYIQNRSLRNEKILKFYLVVESPFDKEEPALNELQTYTKLLNDILKPEGMDLTRLNGAEIYTLLYQKLNPSSSAFDAPDTALSLNGLCPSIIDTTQPMYYVVDDMYYRSYTISSFPTKSDRASWLAPIFELPISLDFSMTLAATDKEAVLRQLNKSIKAIRQMKADSEKDALQMKQMERREKDAEHLLEEMSNENEALFRTTMVITLRAHSLEELKNAEKTFRTRMSSKNMQAKPLNRWAFQPLWYTLPICYKGEMEKHIKYDLPALTIGSMQPFSSSTLAGTDGIVMGLNEQSNDFIIITEAMRKRNPHTVAIADTRAGKSFWMYADILRKRAQGRIVIDIDPERERDTIPGTHVVFSLNRNTCLNPFHIRSTVVDSGNSRGEESTKPGDYLRLKIERLKTFFRWIHPSMDSLELAALDEAMIKTYAAKGFTFDSEELPETFPTLSEFMDILKGFGEDTQKLCRSLTPFVGSGTYAKMFDGQTNWGFTHPVTYRSSKGDHVEHVQNGYTRLDIHDLKGGPAQAPLMELLLQDVWEFVKQDRSMIKEIFIDEMWIISDPENPHTLQFIFEMSKRGGKYGVRMTSATQNVADFLRTKEGMSQPPGQAIISNSGVKLLLRLDKKDIAAISEFVQLSEKEKKVILNAQQGHGIVIVGNQHAQIHTFMTDAELRLYDPEKWRTIHEKQRA